MTGKGVPVVIMSVKASRVVEPGLAFGLLKREGASCKMLADMLPRLAKRVSVRDGVLLRARAR